MKNFRSLDELIKMLDREKKLLQEMFLKRSSLSMRYDIVLSLVDEKQERLEALIAYGLLRESGDFIEIEDLYLKFFEEVLQVNEEVNVAYIQAHIDSLKENIDYYLKENNEKRRYSYYHEVSRILKGIALTTMRNTIDLRRNIDTTYKNEPNFQIKKAKLERFSQKIQNIISLVNRCEDIIDKEELTFFTVAMDAQMRDTVYTVKIQLIESTHNLMDIQRQIVQYLNLIEYQNRITEKVRKLKYLKDQFRLREGSDIKTVIATRNELWMEDIERPRIKLSLDYLHNSDEAIQLISKVLQKHNTSSRPSKLSPNIDSKYLQTEAANYSEINIQELYNSFNASSYDLFEFVNNYTYKRETSEEERLVIFCQIVSEFSSQINYTGRFNRTDKYEYPIILPR